MKNSILFLVNFLFLLSCITEPTTTISIDNQNDYPISVHLKANNIIQDFKNIAPHQLIEKQFTWGNIEKKDGQWHFDISNDATGLTDTFTHGYFTLGELNNFVNLISKGGQLKVDIFE